MSERVRRVLWTVAYWLPFVLVALFLHFTVWCMGLRWAPQWIEPHPERAAPEYVTVRIPQTIPEAVPATLPPEELARLMEERVYRDADGQIVEVAKPLVEQRPDEAQYVSEYDVTVPEETRAPEFRINPEVVAPDVSDESSEESVASEEQKQGDADESSEERPDRFDPERDGALGSLPFASDPDMSRWSRAMREGTSSPSDAVSEDSRLAGAPQNDRLFEETGDGTYLNTKEQLYAEYIRRIRRLVNFYWSQNIDNLPSSVRVARPEYTTGVRVVLDADGRLESIEVIDESGIPVLDDAVVRAFKIAGPFPNPPSQLVSSDGRVYLPDSSWTVTFGSAGAGPAVVDPNADVQFPGLHTNPR